MSFVILAACAHVRERPPPDEPFTCHGPPAPPIADPIVTHVPSGRFVIEAIPGTALTGPAAEGKRNDELLPKMRVLAEATPLSAFALRLGAVTGLAVSVDPSVADVQVSFGSPSVSYREVLSLLALFRVGAVETRDSRDPGHWSVRLKTLEQGRRGSCGPVLTFQVIPADHIDAVQFARLLCEQVLGPRGQATVVGSTLFLRDHPRAVSRARRLFRALDRPDGANLKACLEREEGLCVGQ